MPLVVKQGLRFDGLTDYVDCGNGSSLNITGNGTLTLEAWVNSSIPTNNQFRGILAKTSGGGISSIAYFLDWNLSSYLRIGISDGTTSQILLTSNPYTFDGGWHHIMGVVGSSTMYLYIDGTLNASLSRTVSIRSDLIGLRIGQAFNDPTHCWSGQIGATRIYNRALSGQEVAANYAGTVTRSGLVGEWLFQEGTGTTTADTSGNGNTGTITEATWLIRKPGTVKPSPKKPKKNMLPSFNSGKWTLHANATAPEPYKLVLNATGVGQSSSSPEIIVPPNTTYAFSCVMPSGTYAEIWYRKTGGSTALVKTITAQSDTFTTPSDAVTVSVVLSNSTASGSFTFTNPQLEQGSTATAFEAYQLINDIKPTRMKPKKNFIPTDPTAWELSGIDFFSGLNADNTARIRTKDYTPCVPLQNYILTCGSYWIGAIWYDKNKNYVGSTNTQVASGSTISVPYNAWFFRFSLKRSDNSIISDLSDIPIAKPQLEQGSTATAFEAYTLIPDVKLALR